MFQKIAEKIKTNYKKSLINKNCYALFENKLKEGNRFFGKDELSNPVIVESKENLVGKIKEVKIIDANQSTLFSKICDKSVEGIRSINMSEISKLEQSLKIKKIDKQTVNLQITDNEMLISIAGQFDQNLKKSIKINKYKFFFQRQLYYL